MPNPVIKLNRLNSYIKMELYFADPYQGLPLSLENKRSSTLLASFSFTYCPVLYVHNDVFRWEKFRCETYTFFLITVLFASSLCVVCTVQCVVQDFYLLLMWSIIWCQINCILGATTNYFAEQTLHFFCIAYLYNYMYALIVANFCRK